VNSHNDDRPPAVRRSKLEITQVSIDLMLGLFSFTYADGITEHMQLRDASELPAVSAFLTALTTEVEQFGRPQRRPAVAEQTVTEHESPQCNG
jgi:hypothetical protein